jgi:hypothetical protein
MPGKTGHFLENIVIIPLSNHDDTSYLVMILYILNHFIPSICQFECTMESATYPSAPAERVALGCFIYCGRFYIMAERGGFEPP